MIIVITVITIHSPDATADTTRAIARADTTTAPQRETRYRGSVSSWAVRGRVALGLLAETAV